MEENLKFKEKNYKNTDDVLNYLETFFNKSANLTFSIISDNEVNEDDYTEYNDSDVEMSIYEIFSQIGTTAFKNIVPKNTTYAHLYVHNNCYYTDNDPAKILKLHIEKLKNELLILINFKNKKDNNMIHSFSIKNKNDNIKLLKFDSENTFRSYYSINKSINDTDVFCGFDDTDVLYGYDLLSSEDDENYKIFECSSASEILDVIESYIHKNEAMLNITSDQASSFFETSISLSGSQEHKDFCKAIGAKYSPIKKDKFYYEHGRETLIMWLTHKFLFKKSLGFTLRAFDYRKSAKKIVSKLHGFGIQYYNNKYILVKLCAKDLLDSYSTDSKTGEKIQPCKDDIYCGLDENDVICGFDL